MTLEISCLEKFQQLFCWVILLIISLLSFNVIMLFFHFLTIGNSRPKLQSIS